MAQKISVFLETEDKRIDLNKHGLLSMSFERYNSIASKSTLNNLDLVMFDSTGDELLGILASNNDGSIRIQYGFTSDKEEETKMSPVYSLNVIKLKPRWTNRATTISVGAYGVQIKTDSPPRLYSRGTPIVDILYDLSAYNEWDTEINLSRDIVIDRDLLKEEGMEDIEFIATRLHPIAERATIYKKNSINFYDVKLVARQVGRPLFYFLPKNTMKRKVWTYSVGTTDYSEVIDCTLDIDMSFLIGGFNITIPATDPDFLLMKGRGEDEEHIKKLLQDKKPIIQGLLDRYNIPMTIPNSINFNVTIVPPEGDDPALAGLSTEERIVKALGDAIKFLSTTKLVVVGNPYIQPNDLIALDIRNMDGTQNILSSGASGSYWEVIRINESIGLDGYKTELTLVRQSTGTVNKGGSGGNVATGGREISIEEIH